MKGILIAVGVLILLGIIGVLIVSNSSTEPSDFQNNDTTTVGDTTDNTETVDDTPDGSGSVPVGYHVYRNSELKFSIVVPNGATASESAEDVVRFKFLGPDNEPDTEITDGFTLTVFRDMDAGQYTTVRAYAEAEAAQDARENGDEVTLEARSVSGMSAYRYTYENELGGDTTVYIFLPDDGEEGYKLSYSISDPHDVDYESVIFRMLESVRFRDDVANRPPTTDRVFLAMLDYPASGGLYTNESDGKERGCDRVVMVEREIEPTTAPLTAAMNVLFTIDSETYAGWQNFIAKTNSTLAFDYATVEDGVASIYFTGELSGLGGACDNPRAAIQIEETALQFSTVNSVNLYLNGELTDDLGASAGGA